MLADVEALRWRVPLRQPVLKVVGAALFGTLATTLGRDDPVEWSVAGLCALGLLAWAVRDVVAPVRLAADAEGLTVVVGYARRRHLPWNQIERVHLDRRQRLGISTELLEIDAGDAIHQFSALDLGAEPGDVAAALTALRT
jgi:hypothetical protein